MQRLELVLREVRDVDVVAELALSAVGLERTGEHLEQRGLAGAVGPDERDLVASVQREVEILVHDVVVVGLRHAFESDDELTGARRLREPELDHLARLGQHDPLDLLELLHAVLGLLGLGVLVPEAFDERLHVRDLLLLRLVRGLELLEGELARGHVRRVGARVDRDLALVDLGDVVDEVLHERTVVADEDDRALVGTQEALDPGDRLEVEVVGRLVEQEHVGLAEQQLRERKAHLPAAGELVGEPLEVRLLEAEAEEHRARV